MDQTAAELEGPLYFQLFNTLKEEILAGQYDSSGVLPSEKQLEERFGVSRITVRRAVEELERAGFAERAKGRATRLTERHPPMLADVDDELANMLAAISDLETCLHHFRWLTAGRNICAALDVALSEKILWIVRTRSRQNQPVMHSVLWLPEWVGKGLTRGDLAAGTIVGLVRARGIKLTSGEQSMRAQPCSKDVAARLGIKEGEPVFFIRRLIRAADGRPVMFNDVTFRWDAFTYDMALEPARGGAREGLQLLTAPLA